MVQTKLLHLCTRNQSRIALCVKYKILVAIDYH